jgi:rubredoxin
MRHPAEIPGRRGIFIHGDVDDMARWVCSVCDYEYVEGAGDPATGIPPGTRFEDLPDDWRCPDCGAGKEAFVRAGEEEETNDEDAL